MAGQSSIKLRRAINTIKFKNINNEDGGHEINKRSKRILVIDDQDVIRKSFVLALEDMEYQVDTAESGERGMADFLKNSKGPRKVE
jgi:PleD family two-component response regulator